jgi:hypothetical protein
MITKTGIRFMNGLIRKNLPPRRGGNFAKIRWDVGLKFFEGPASLLADEPFSKSGP